MSATKDTSTPTTSKTASSEQAPVPTQTKKAALSSSGEVLGKIIITVKRRGRKPDIRIIGDSPIPVGYMARAHREVQTALGKFNAKKTKERRAANARREEERNREEGN